ncbi:MAG: polymer-forming cytoskeletal protein [Gemmatimonadales bacterium]
MTTRRLSTLAAGLAALALAASFSCQAADAQAERARPDDLLIRVNGPALVGPGDSTGALVVVGSDAIVEGLVSEGLLVVSGTVRLSGEVEGSVVVANGHAELLSGSRIDGDLILYRSTVSREPGATIGGQTHTESGLSFGRGFLIFTWIGFTMALTLAAAIFAGIGGRLLDRAVRALSERPGASLASAAIVYVGLPFVAFFALVTLIGSVLGVGILAVLMPALWVLGYLVASAWLGRRLLPLLKAEEPPERPYAAATLGVIAAQVIGLVPLVGGLAVMVAGCLGAGTLAHLAWTEWRRPTREAAMAEGSSG